MVAQHLRISTKFKCLNADQVLVMPLGKNEDCTYSWGNLGYPLVVFCFSFVLVFMFISQ